MKLEMIVNTSIWSSIWQVFIDMLILMDHWNASTLRTGFIGMLHCCVLNALILFSKIQEPYIDFRVIYTQITVTELEIWKKESLVII